MVRIDADQIVIRPAGEGNGDDNGSDDSDE